ncbi:hypothetical protein, partial [Phocaeicola plebeius]|uniref:hypothetical protein n=1 Tax=Phocaeicola plebeius TaxID=310297 RepID=UPI003F992B98
MGTKKHGLPQITKGKELINKSIHLFYVSHRGCLKIELRWPLLFYFKLKSFGFFSKKEAYKLTFSIQ